jgi:hypothetical protein
MLSLRLANSVAVFLVASHSVSFSFAEHGTQTTVPFQFANPPFAGAWLNVLDGPGKSPQFEWDADFNMADGASGVVSKHTSIAVAGASSNATTLAQVAYTLNRTTLGRTYAYEGKAYYQSTSTSAIIPPGNGFSAPRAVFAEEGDSFVGILQNVHDVLARSSRGIFPVVL